MVGYFGWKYQKYHLTARPLVVYNWGQKIKNFLQLLWIQITDFWTLIDGLRICIQLSLRNIEIVLAHQKKKIVLVSIIIIKLKRYLAEVVVVWVSHFWPSLLAFLTLLIFASYYFKILWVFTMTVFCFNSIMADYSIILLPILPKKKGDFGLNLSHTHGL